MIHILFDVDGVLIRNFHVDPQKAYLWWLDPAQRLLDAALMTEHFFKPRWPDIMTGKKDVLPELDAALREMNADISAEAYLAHWLKADSKVDHALFAEIRKLPRDNIKLSLATNQEHKRASYLWNDLNFKADFADIFYAARLGLMKPDEAFFREVAKRLDIGPADTVIYFDDTAKCTEAASKLGWQAVTYSEVEHFTGHPAIQQLMKAA